MQEAEYYPFVLLDEIGGLDLVVPQFREALKELLRKETALLGVVKEREEAENLRELFGLGKRFMGYYDELIEMIEAGERCRILQMGEEATEQALEEWRQRFLPG